MVLNEIWNSFKAVSYGLQHMGAAVYIDLAQPGYRLLPDEFGRPLIFSGVTLSGRAPSTVNDAEAIVAKILAQEKIGHADRDFYDLQTWKGYPRFQKGQFILNRLSIEGGEEIRVTMWNEVKDLSEKFTLLFSCLIGHVPTNMAR